MNRHRTGAQRRIWPHRPPRRAAPGRAVPRRWLSPVADPYRGAVTGSAGQPDPHPSRPRQRNAATRTGAARRVDAAGPSPRLVRRVGAAPVAQRLPWTTRRPRPAPPAASRPSPVARPRPPRRGPEPAVQPRPPRRGPRPAVQPGAADRATPVAQRRPPRRGPEPAVQPRRPRRGPRPAVQRRPPRDRTAAAARPRPLCRAPRRPSSAVRRVGAGPARPATAAPSPRPAPRRRPQRIRAQPPPRRHGTARLNTRSRVAPPQTADAAASNPRIGLRGRRSPQQRAPPKPPATPVRPPRRYPSAAHVETRSNPRPRQPPAAAAGHPSHRTARHSREPTFRAHSSVMAKLWRFSRQTRDILWHPRPRSRYGRTMALLATNSRRLMAPSPSGDATLTRPSRPTRYPNSKRAIVKRVMAVMRQKLWLAS